MPMRKSYSPSYEGEQVIYLRSARLQGARDNNLEHQRNGSAT